MGMRLGFHGAAGTVTGSRYLLQLGERRVLVDCGLFQGYKQLRLRNWDAPPFDPAALDAVVLTHAHLDHSGWLPVLVARGFRGKVFCTEGTRDLCRVLLPDSARLQEEDAERANRRRYTKHAPARPLYTSADAERALARLVPHDWHDPLELVPGLTLRFFRAGHIVGAAMAELRGGGTSVLFSGDLGRLHDPIMLPPEHVPGVQYLVLESTYGDRQHPASDPADELRAVIDRVCGRGGILMLPAFAVGRVQALLWYLHRLKASGAIPADLPIFLNSPLAQDATAVYARHRAAHRLTPAQCEAACRVAHYVDSIEESKALNRRAGPMVIIAGSGMATGGRILHHLQAFAGDPRNAIVLVGFQAGGTRGAQLAAGAERLRIHGRDLAVRAEVLQLHSLSAHADHVELLGWLRGFAREPDRTFITHGEPAAADALRVHIGTALGWPCTVPEHGAVTELDGAA